MCTEKNRTLEWLKGAAHETVQTMDDSALLVERLDFYDRCAVVAARPDGGGRCGIVGEDAAHVGIARHEIFGVLAGLGIDLRKAVGGHASGIHVPGLVPSYVIRSGPRNRQRPFRNLLRLGIEHSDPVALIF